MAIQMRRGNKADFDPTKMLPGEWAVSIDSDTTKQWVWMCFAPGVVKRMAAFEDIEWVLSDEFAKSSVICDVELDSTATKAYAVGDFLMLHGHLYQVTASIAIGDTITEGTNVSETTVMAELDGKVDKETGKGLSTEDYTSAEKTKLGDLPTATDLQTSLDGKVDKVEGKGLSTEDYSTTEKTKLAGLPTGTDLADDLSDLNQAISDLDGSVVKSVNTKTPTNGAVEINAGDIPADGIGDKSVSGNPITIEDGMASVAKELSVTIEPIQDLHGYESPWIGTDTDKAPYLFRAVADSSVQDKGTHEMDKLIGGTMAFNQLVQNGNFADGTTGWDARNSVVSVSGNTALVTVSSAGTERGLKVSDSSAFQFTAVVGHKYLISAEVNSPTTAELLCAFSGRSGTRVPVTANTWTRCQALYEASATIGQVTLYIRQALSQDDVIQYKNVNCIDLTQMFGSTIADYIYSLEQATAGAGVSFFRNLFPAPYYAYDFGTLMSVKTSAHVTRGFNQWDEEWENGSYSTNDGTKIANASKVRNKNLIPVLPNARYFCNLPSNVTALNAFWYDKNQQFVFTDDSYGIRADWEFTVPDGCYYLAFSTFGTSYTTYQNDICFNLSKTTGTPKNGDYVAYDGHSYALDSDLELRGIPKLDSNNKLYYDGDIYEASGNVQRKYGIVDLGTLEWTFFTPWGFQSNTALSNIVLPASDNDIIYTVSSKYTYASPNAIFIPQRDKELGIRPSGKVVITDSDTLSMTAAQFKASLNGIYLVYPLATPTSETADPFTSTQVIDPDGTEEYVDSRTVAIPVGHESNYANICPIEGRTGTEVGRKGKNLFDSDVLLQASLWVKNDGYYTGTADNLYTQFGDGYGGFPDLKFRENVQYTVRYTGHSSDASGNFRFRFLYTDGTLSDASYLNSTSDITISLTSTAGKTIDKLAVRYGSNKTIYLKDIQLEEGSTATSYEPYSKDTASVTFGQTVYGCTHDFVTGKCRVTHAIVELDENSGWSKTTSGPYVCNAITDYSRESGVSCLCSHFAGQENVSQALDVADHSCSFYRTTTSTNPYRFYINESSIATIEAWNAWIAQNPVTVCYKLATPIELTLTPAQLTLLQGTNILTADGTINLTYLGSMASNVQDEIDEFEQGLNNVIGSIAFIENSTAKTSHAVGDYVILNGIFCKVISAISSGETLSFGTNIQATTIGAELKAIWAQLNA